MNYYSNIYEFFYALKNHNLDKNVSYNFITTKDKLFFGLKDLDIQKEWLLNKRFVSIRNVKKAINNYEEFILFNFCLSIYNKHIWTIDYLNNKYPVKQLNDIYKKYQLRVFS